MTELARVIDGRWGDVPPPSWRLLRRKYADEERRAVLHDTHAVKHDDMGGMIEMRSRCGVRRPASDWTQPPTDWVGSKCERCLTLTDPFYDVDD